jgi:tRNA-specific 2-thiouridylase
VQLLATLNKNLGDKLLPLSPPPPAILAGHYAQLRVDHAAPALSTSADATVRNGSSTDVASTDHAPAAGWDRGARVPPSELACSSSSRARSNVVQLLQGADPLKDQSYFLAAVRQDALQHCLFPVGELSRMPSIRCLFPTYRGALSDAL